MMSAAIAGEIVSVIPAQLILTAAASWSCVRVVSILGVPLNGPVLPVTKPPDGSVAPAFVPSTPHASAPEILPDAPLLSMPLKLVQDESTFIAAPALYASCATVRRAGGNPGPPRETPVDLI